MPVYGQETTGLARCTWRHALAGFQQGHGGAVFGTTQKVGDAGADNAASDNNNVAVFRHGEEKVDWMGMDFGATIRRARTAT